ncbi:MAG: hypothetical protein QXI19_09125 [Candidatus Caldarchaeum sp.]
MSKNSVSSLFDEMRSFLREIGAEKSASHRLRKQADGYDSSHPTEDVDDNTTDFPSTEREKEHDKDVKENVGPGNVVSVSENKLSDYDTNPVQGTTPSAVGEDKKTENKYKANKEDPGTDHPATTEDGEKYGSYAQKDFFDLYKQASEKCNDILSVISVRLTQGAQVPSPANTIPVGPTEKSAAAYSGVNSYDFLEQSPSDQMIKLAAVKQTIAQTIADAYLAADLTAGYLGQYSRLVKAAEEGNLPMGDEATEKPVGTSEDSTSSPENKDEDEGEGTEDTDLESTDSGSNLDIPVSLGGTDTASSPPTGEGDLGKVDNQEAVDQLLMSLMEMGVTPEQLEQAVDSKSPQELGGIGAGVPPEVAKTAGVVIKSSFKKLASAASKLLKQKVKKGNLAYRPPSSRQEFALREQVRNCIRDIMSL